MRHRWKDRISFPIKFSFVMGKRQLWKMLSAGKHVLKKQKKQKKLRQQRLQRVEEAMSRMTAALAQLQTDVGAAMAWMMQKEA